jgi:hypothetical protein
MQVDDDLFARMVVGIQLAAITFRKYEKLHRAKGTEDSNLKAEVNRHHAEQLEALDKEAMQVRP